MSEPPGLSGEVPGAGVDVDGAVAPRVGRDRGARPRPGRHRPGGAGEALHAQVAAVVCPQAAGMVRHPVPELVDRFSCSTGRSRSGP